MVAAHIFIHIVKGLHELYRLNIFHRDLKSANIFLNKDGTCKLGDFNVSKISKKGLQCTYSFKRFIVKSFNCRLEHRITLVLRSGEIFRMIKRPIFGHWDV